jgi:RNA recognition motif-containing protein
MKKKSVVKKKPLVKSSFKSNEKKVTLYISGLRYDKDEEGVMWFFTPFGYVESVQIIKDKNTKLPKGIAFVKMERESDGLKAVKGLDGKVVEGRTLKVSVAKERPEFKKEFIPKDPNKPIRKTTKEENIYKAKVKKEKKTGLDKLLKYKSSKK